MAEAVDPQAALQANRATFFFKVVRYAEQVINHSLTMPDFFLQERELAKVNAFYLLKEAEVCSQSGAQLS